MHWEQIFLTTSESLIVCHSNQIHVSSDLISYWGKVWRSLVSMMSMELNVQPLQAKKYTFKGYSLQNPWNVPLGTQKWFFCRIAQKTPFWNLFRV